MLRRTGIALAAFATTAALSAVPALAAQPAAAGHDTVTHGMLVRGVHAAKPNRSGSKQLTYHGGAVNLTPKVYIVYWGTQWGSAGSINDPKGLVPLQLDFFNGTDTSAWAKSTLQYCSGVSGITGVGATSCPTPAAALSGNLVAGSWLDTSPEPARATQSDLAGEAQRAAARAVNFDHISISNVQFIIDSPSGNGPSGFGTQYCAWHSSTTYNNGSIAYTNMPYVPDAGTSCGANFVSSAGTENSDANEGVTIVGGHEWAETVTDEYPNGGWLDGSGAENGDKCAWISSGQGASAAVNIGTSSFVVQSLWSNAFNNTGGCVLTS